MKVEGTQDSKIVESVSAATDSKLVFNDAITACTLSDGAMYHIKPGSFHIHKARAGNNPQSGPPFVRFIAIMEGASGRPHETMVETFLTSLVAVFYPVPEDKADDETDEKS
ncbi:hypothetical protein HWB99_gp082 [Mycobacterium phage DrLupo]|uniref:Uncharacterized protein n=1 Tax=Mycobacterium phage DrLupo TaxID=2499037 RepID=A0A3S9UQN4_9CAUD|nr:hypothetical protein HWB99_gp082 [Mycobacterium phage DrLupo]AZS12618.1 hypothetical protein SEA_DRLUPO_82 [Mycobacterium phage DrLupo]